MIRPWAAAFLCIVSLFVSAQAAVTPELQRAIREQTFEVVMKKPEKDPVTYEKPLPLDLLPFYERNDAYRSVGTAFALGHNSYVTAAHVMVTGVNSQYGPPSLRRADGSVFAIDRILKFSLSEDFVVFTLREDPAGAGFSINRMPKIDEAVMAVGNALGEGIVIRDGLFTSETPEDKDGRWKWIRFSAAASPGNSGGPLLDGAGMVIGIIIGKSPNENLNYSLPIGRVLDAEDQKASFDQRALVRLSYLRGTYTYNYQDQFRLPLAWPQFVAAFKAVVERHDEEGRANLLKTYTAELFPKGSGTDDLFFEPDANDCLPRLIMQEADGRWVAPKPDYKKTELPGDGSVSVAAVAGTTLLRLVRPNAASDDGFYKDSKAFMDLALKALDIRRPVGQDQVRMTSLGAAQSDSVVVDTFGRKWQKRTWAIPFMDFYVTGLLLPTPDGYDAIIQFVPSQVLAQAQVQTQMLAGQLDVSYRGTLAQWQAGLQRRDLLPQALLAVKLDKANSWTLRTSRVTASVAHAVLPLADKSPLRLVMGFMRDGQNVTWDIQEVWWSEDERENASLGLWRRAKPPAEAKLEFRNKFADMSERRGAYDGVINRDSMETFSLTDIRPAPGKKPGWVSSDLLYGLTVRLAGHPSLQDATKAMESFDAAVQIIEPGIGKDVVARQSGPSAVSEAFAFFEKDMLQKAEAAETAEGRDIRGRLLRDDLKDFFNQVQKEMLSIPMGGSVEEESWKKMQEERERHLEAYWQLYPALLHNKEIWPIFLAHNGLAPNTPHTDTVVNAQNALLLALQSPQPTKDWQDLGTKLMDAYIDERNKIVKSKKFTPEKYQPRLSACTPPASRTSGKKTVMLERALRSAEDYWTLDSKRLGEEGVVLVSLKISSTGCATAATIVGSSGFDALDQAVMQFYESLEFLPAEADGSAIESTATIPVAFKPAQVSECRVPCYIEVPPYSPTGEIYKRFNGVKT